MTPKVLARDPMSVDCGAPFPGRFAAELKLCGDKVLNHTLTIVLRPHMIKKHMGQGLPVLPPGAEKYPWENGEWTEFLRKFKQVAEAAWHRRFCLIPPKEATYFDKHFGLPIFGDNYMPNIECHFQIEWGTPTDRHRDVECWKNVGLGTIDAETGGLGPASIDSTDVDQPAGKKVDGQVFIQIAAAHEVGHMLGQPHSGILLNSNNCLRAVKLNITEKRADLPDSKYLLNSHNANACYGIYDGKPVPAVAENIMGLGSTLAEVNAISWQKALEILAPEAKVPGWKVVLEPYVQPRKL